MFYARLGRTFYLREWEEIYGPVISTFLNDWLSVDVPTSGPYRYVGAVYRHAGIPAPARAGFCQLVVRLLQAGFAFTRNQYTEAVRKLPSSVARHFLESDAGYEFTRQTARTILRLDHGQISSDDLEAFPPYRRSLYVSALETLRGTPKGRCPSSTTIVYPRPTLGLDITTRRLILQFDPQGVNANVYRTAKGPVYYAAQAVAGTESPLYLIKPEVEWCRISPWWSPGQSQCALFRASDSSLVGELGGVAPGRYYMVTHKPELIPRDCILEEAVYLENDDADALGLYYSIVFADLPQGTTIPELSIHVKGTVATPTLEFANPRQLRHPLGNDIFCGRLPALHIQNWTADYSNKYWIPKRAARTVDRRGRSYSRPCRSCRTGAPRRRDVEARSWKAPLSVFR